MSEKKTCKDWFAEADAEFIQAIQRLMCASTGDAFLGGSRECSWTEFHREMARVEEYARLRHAAKHAAQREALLSCEPIRIRIP